jgi:hypothetical protein
MIEVLTTPLQFVPNPSCIDEVWTPECQSGTSTVPTAPPEPPKPPRTIPTTTTADDNLIFGFEPTTLVIIAAVGAGLYFMSTAK